MKAIKLLLCATCILYVTSLVYGMDDSNNQNLENESNEEHDEETARSRRSGYQDNNDGSRGRAYNYNSNTNHNSNSNSNSDDTNQKRRATDLFSSLKSKIKPKIGSILSVSSPGHHYDAPPLEYGPPASYGHKSFNIWGFKKAIFGAIVQAVKAITGGVLALKGQLIKVKGHLVETKGKILQTKGEAISQFGRHVATKALLNPPAAPPSAHAGYAPSGYGHGHGHSHVVETISHGHGYTHGGSYGPPPPPPSSAGAYGPPPPSPPSGWGSAPSPPAPFSSAAYGPPPQPALPPAYGVPLPAEYGAPTGFGKEYGPPFKRDASAIQEGVQAGLLVLKPFKVPSQGASLMPQNHGRTMEYSGADNEGGHHHV